MGREAPSLMMLFGATKLSIRRFLHNQPGQYSVTRSLSNGTWLSAVYLRSMLLRSGTGTQGQLAPANDGEAYDDGAVGLWLVANADTFVPSFQRDGIRRRCFAHDDCSRVLDRDPRSSWGRSRDDVVRRYTAAMTLRSDITIVEEVSRIHCVTEDTSHDTIRCSS